MRTNLGTYSVADPDLELRGGEGRFFIDCPAGFSSFSNSFFFFFLSKIKRPGPGLPGPSSRSTTDIIIVHLILHLEHHVTGEKFLSCDQRRNFFVTISKHFGKISAQPHPTLCIQFLNRENNDKNNTFPLGKQICFTIVWGCAETLPRAEVKK